jgi:hypothetical protein
MCCFDGIDNHRDVRARLNATISADRDADHDQFATTAFDRSSSRWLGISDLIAEPAE